MYSSNECTNDNVFRNTCNTLWQSRLCIIFADEKKTLIYEFESWLIIEKITLIQFFNLVNEPFGTILRWCLNGFRGALNRPPYVAEWCDGFCRRGLHDMMVLTVFQWITVCFYLLTVRTFKYFFSYFLYSVFDLLWNLYLFNNIVIYLLIIIFRFVGSFIVYGIKFQPKKKSIHCVAELGLINASGAGYEF